GARQLAPQHPDHVDLDANHRAVALVSGPVGALLERPHVAEGAALGAPHVGVERPAEIHPAHPVEGGSAWLLAGGGAHGRSLSLRARPRETVRWGAGSSAPALQRGP